MRMCVPALLRRAEWYFNAADFPANMAKIWTKRFAFIAEQDLAPVVIGEMGGFYDAPGNPSGQDPDAKDKVWQDWAVEFMDAHSIGAPCSQGENLPLDGWIP